MAFGDYAPGVCRRLGLVYQWRECRQQEYIAIDTKSNTLNAIRGIAITNPAMKIFWRSV